MPYSGSTMAGQWVRKDAPIGKAWYCKFQFGGPHSMIVVARSVQVQQTVGGKDLISPAGNTYVKCIDVQFMSFPSSPTYSKAVYLETAWWGQIELMHEEKALDRAKREAFAERFT